MQKKVIDVTFNDQPKGYTFSVGNVEAKRGDNLIVSSSKGILFGKASSEIFEEEENSESAFMPVLRVATKADEQTYTDIHAEEISIKKEIKQLVSENNWNFKVVSVELSFDKKFLTVNFSSDEYVEFKDVARVLSPKFKAKVELRQLGPREEVKTLGGIGVCGKMCCCKQYMQDFNKVSLKMAKNQGISLSPTKTNGLCGRLMCCLAYENDYYIEAEKDMPKIGSVVMSPRGEGKVVFNNLVTKRSQLVFDELDRKKKEYQEFAVSELEFKKREPKNG